MGDAAHLTDERAARAAAAVARRHALGDPVRPLRASANHVFRTGDVIIRVARRSADVAGQVALASWLVAEGFPVAAPLAGPEVVDGVQVSLWAHIDADASRPVDFEQFGNVIARLHRIDPSRLEDVVALPFCGDAAWLDVEARLAEAHDLLDADGVAALERQCVKVRGWQQRAHVAGLVVCHGDAHPQNALMTDDGVVVIDWDAICLGPPAFDHAALMTWEERWGGAPGTYADFARGYGADLRDSPLASELAVLRLLAPTINMVINGATNPTCAAEARERMRYWLGAVSSPVWTAL